MKYLGGLLANPTRSASFLFAILLLIRGYFALTEGDFYGIKGVALHWFEMLGGAIILIGLTGRVKYIKPPYLYIWVGLFAYMFAVTIGWI